ncbi:glycoside hydrolase family 27 protein [Thermophagus sp. OGC60D27]|uniref:glycoside hydrolase family 27 protein n=1 Tax=Thermophagus sp. OGC60D27 TaxID=3458415 RepID=UPI00403848E5
MISKTSKLGILIFLSGFFIQAQKFEELALTPPMGWNSWNKFGCQVNEALIRSIADAMVESGMKDAGYEYIVIDDCWHGGRDSQGFIYPDSSKFPNGMKALADYVHRKGLKLGIYSDAGTKTCAGYPGSRGFEYQDALQYAQWGIDYLKYDWCNTENINPIGAYSTMRDALYKAGRPVLFSMCEWGTSKPWKWANDIAHMWRTTGDIFVCWDCKHDHGGWYSWGVMKILDMQDGLRQYAGPGHWNDPDMLEVGNGLSVNEDRAHFSMWAMLAAPLIAGNDLRNMSKETIEILTNQEVIAVNQDSLGIQGFKYNNLDSLEVWFKPLSHDEWAVCFLNRRDQPAVIEFEWKKENVVDEIFGFETAFNEKPYSIRNLWTKKNIGKTKKAFNATVPPHDVIMLRLTPLK